MNSVQRYVCRLSNSLKSLFRPINLIPFLSCFSFKFHRSSLFSQLISYHYLYYFIRFQSNEDFFNTFIHNFEFSKGNYYVSIKKSLYSAVIISKAILVELHLNEAFILFEAKNSSFGHKIVHFNGASPRFGLFAYKNVDRFKAPPPLSCTIFLTLSYSKKNHASQLSNLRKIRNVAIRTSNEPFCWRSCRDARRLVTFPSEASSLH